MSRAYLCVSITVASDKDRDGGVQHPPSFEGVTDGVLRRIHPFFERFGARPTYLLSPAVLGDPGCLEAFRTLASSAELGTHLDGKAAGDRAALTEVTDLFIRAFGHQPQSFSAGPGGLEPASIGILESLGYAVDGSITPQLDRAGGGPTQPYRPDPEEPDRAGTAAIVEVPVTTRRHPLHALPGIGRRIGLRGLRLTRGTTEGVVRVAEDELAAARRDAPSRPAILHAALESVAAVPHASPRGANEESARGILDRLRALLAFARRAGVPVVGLADVPELLRQ